MNAVSADDILTRIRGPEFLKCVEEASFPGA